MALVKQKNWGLERAKEATNQKSTNKTRQSTSNFTKHWKFIWQSYASEEQDGRAVPMETKETFFSLKPSQSQIDQLRKMGHSVGYRLVSIQSVEPSTADEF